MTMEHESTSKRYKCSKCGKFFETMDELGKHNRQEHGADSPIIGQISATIEAQVPAMPNKSR